jgi:hypothetical protein
VARPAFAKEYPDDAELLALCEAFDRGDYRAVREGVKRITDDKEKPEEVRRAARDLKSRTEPSRLQLVLLAITAALIATLSIYEIAHRHNH